MKLLDAEKQHSKHPTTFHIPSREERENVSVGMFVKLVFNESERMWVIVTKIEKNHFIGTLDNDPTVVDLKCGDEIEFKSKHIIGVIK